MQYLNYLPISSTPIKYLLDQQRRTCFPSTFTYEQIPQVAGVCLKKGAIALAAIVTGIALPVLLTTDAAIHLLRKCKIVKIATHHSDFHYFFHSAQLFDHYVLQMQENAKTILKEYPGVTFSGVKDELATNTAAFIDKLLHPPQLTSSALRRQFHESIVNELRALVVSKSRFDLCESQYFIEKFCESLYIDLDMMGLMNQFMKETGSVDLDMAPLNRLSAQINSLHRRLNSSPQFGGVSEETRLYDPRYLGDVPSVVFMHSSLKNQKQIKMIRTPVITKDVKRRSHSLGRAEVVNEFIGFLDSYKRQGKKHLYINLMQRIGSEGVRSKAVEELETNYQSQFAVVTLSKDCDFYWQRGVHSCDANIFRQRFIQALFAENGHYRWPSFLMKDPKWHLECGKILERIHTNYFNSRDQLQLNERLDFIEIAYLYIIEALFERIEPDSCNVSCKSCIDRGAAVLAELYALKQGKNLSNLSHQTHLTTLTLAPALLAQNRVMQQSRMNRYKSAMERMLEITR